MVIGSVFGAQIIITLVITSITACITRRINVYIIIAVLARAPFDLPPRIESEQPVKRRWLSVGTLAACTYSTTVCVTRVL